MISLSLVACQSDIHLAFPPDDDRTGDSDSQTARYLGTVSDILVPLHLIKFRTQLDLLGQVAMPRMAYEIGCCIYWPIQYIFIRLVQ
jgi:hypothetical protein